MITPRARAQQQLDTMGECLASILGVVGEVHGSGGVWSFSSNSGRWLWSVSRREGGHSSTEVYLRWCFSVASCAHRSRGVSVPTFA